MATKTIDARMQKAAKDKQYKLETLRDMVNNQTDETLMFEALHDYCKAAAELKTIKAIYWMEQFDKFFKAVLKSTKK